MNMNPRPESILTKLNQVLAPILVGKSVIQASIPTFAVDYEQFQMCAELHGDSVFDHRLVQYFLFIHLSQTPYAYSFTVLIIQRAEIFVKYLSTPPTAIRYCFLYYRLSPNKIF
jgi:hypothetical protein